MKKLAILVLLVGISTCVFSQDSQVSSAQRHYDFKVGDVISSTTGSLKGDYYLSNKKDNNIIGVFTGLNSNRRSEVVKSQGVVEVNVSDINGKVRTGDLLVPVADGKAAKSLETGMILGVALSDAIDGKVNVRLNVSYAK